MPRIVYVTISYMIYTNKTYKKLHVDYDRYQCVYCGELADTMDHVPPRDISERMELEIDHILVPSCNECNRTLSNLFLLTLAERAEYIKRKYAKKYRKYNHSVKWDTDELNELDGSLKMFVSGCQHEYNRIRDRFKKLDHRAFHSDSDLHEYG